MTDKIKARHFIVEDLGVAQHLRSQINNEEQLIEAALDFGITPSAAEGGAMGLPLGSAFSKNQLPPGLENWGDIVFSMAPGEISDPIETDFGYSIAIRLE